MNSYCRLCPGLNKAPSDPAPSSGEGDEYLQCSLTQKYKRLLRRDAVYVVRHPKGRGHESPGRWGREGKAGGDRFGWGLGVGRRHSHPPQAQGHQSHILPDRPSDRQVATKTFAGFPKTEQCCCLWVCQRPRRKEEEKEASKSQKEDEDKKREERKEER